MDWSIAAMSIAGIVAALVALSDRLSVHFHSRAHKD